METALHYGLDEQQLCLKLRQRVTTAPAIELNADGLFNTVTGSLAYRATLKKYVATGPTYKDPGSTPLRVGGGLLMTSGAKESKPQLTFSADKTMALLEGPHTLVEASAHVDFDPEAVQFTARRSSLYLSRKFLNLTQRQDLKLTVGVDLDWPQQTGAARTTIARSKRSVSAIRPSLYFQARENNWAARFMCDRWDVTYDL